MNKLFKQKSQLKEKFHDTRLFFIFTQNVESIRQQAALLARITRDSFQSRNFIFPFN